MSWLLWVFLIVLALIIYLARRKPSDPYGTFHLTLNRLPGDDGPPQTEWLNMGYWEGTERFPEACEALALYLINTAKPKRQGRVLDVGHGSGDSLLLHLTHPAVPRPSILCGITSLHVHHLRSKERISAVLAMHPDLRDQCLTDLHEGDAVCRRDDDPLHPLAFGSPYQFDTILALDCAYHFQSRTRFLEQAFQRLAPGGRVALADICFSSIPNGAAQFLLTSLLHVMPADNVVTRERYVQDMRSIGFEDVQMQDISDLVFSGFQAFLGRQGPIWHMFGSTIGWLRSMNGRFVIVTGTRPLDSKSRNE